jgi:hypothetical protein
MNRYLPLLGYSRPPQLPMVSDYDALFAALARMTASRRKIFVSYHHDEDQHYYNALSEAAHDEYKLIYDNSLDRRINSKNPDFVMRQIREEFITGTSVTVVLCGIETPWRKYVDWEIKATLDKGHGLLAVVLPTNTYRDGYRWVPARLNDNIRSGFAHMVEWDAFTRDAASVKLHIEAARNRPSRLIVNNREMMSRNEPYPFYRPGALAKLLAYNPTLR